MSHRRCAIFIMMSITIAAIMMILTIIVKLERSVI